MRDWEPWRSAPAPQRSILGFSPASSGASQLEELTLLLIQLRRRRAKMAATRQETLAQLGRLDAPKDLQHHVASGAASSPFLCSAPSPITRLGSSSPLGSLSAKVGPRPSAHPSFTTRSWRLPLHLEGVVGDSALYRSTLNASTS